MTWTLNIAMQSSTNMYVIAKQTSKLSFSHSNITVTALKSNGGNTSLVGSELRSSVNILSITSVNFTATVSAASAFCFGPYAFSGG